MYCENCGSYNEEDAVFCVGCGSKLNQRMKEAPKQKGNTMVLIIIAVFVFLIITAVVGVTLFMKSKDKSLETTEIVEEMEEVEESAENSFEDEQEYDIEEYNTDEYEVEEYEVTETVSAVSMSDIVDVTATSVLVEKKRTHSAERIVDGDLTAAWTEGASGTGYGEAVTVYFDDVHRIRGFYIHAGYHKTEKLYWENARPRTLEISCGGVSYGEYSLRDYFGEQVIEFSEPIDSDQLTVTIRDVYEGTKYEDAVISEIYFY